MKKMNVLLFCALLFATTNIKGQDSYVNPLKRWATHNVGELNTFAEGDARATPGMFYQFGRNIPFSGDKTLIRYESAVTTPADEKVWSNSVLIPEEKRKSSNWYSQKDENLNTWKNIASATAAAPDAPKSYLGTNGGDPCPKGWRLPVTAEYASLMTGKFIFNNDVVKTDIDEPVDLYGKGKTENYKADYKNAGFNTVVALRFKNTKDASAFRYRLVNHNRRGSHVEIRAKAAGNADIDAIAEWNDSDWADAEIRQFPVVGFRIDTRDGGVVKSNDLKSVFMWADFTGRHHNTAPSFGFAGWDRDKLELGNYITAYGRAYAFPCRCVEE